MISSQYIFKGRTIEAKLSGFVRDYFASAYESSYKGGFIRVYEDSSYFNKNNYLVLIRVDTTEAEEGIIRIEIIAGGGDDSLFVNGIFGGDRRRAKSFSRALQDFCTENFIDYDPV